MQEHDLGDLGIFRIPVPIPFLNAGGPVNAYIIEEENGFLLFDPGLGTTRCQAALAEGVIRTGHHFNQVNRIILSHGHIDHFGAAAWVQEQAGRTIPISIHDADAGKVLDSRTEWPVLLRNNAGYFSKLGVPLQALDEMVADIGTDAAMGRRLAEVQPLLDGDKIRCKHVTLEVHHMPGHTPGVCCLYERNHRLLFSADHILEHVSPNPLIELGLNGEPSPFKPLVSYFESLDRVRALDIDLVLPGHGTPFGGFIEVIESLCAFYERRQAKLLSALKRGPRTVYEVTTELFPPTSTFELFLMVSEALGNLEFLEHRGRVKREIQSDFIRFRFAG